MEIRVGAEGFDDALKRLDPQRVAEVFFRWMDEAPKYVRAQMRSRAPRIVRSRVKVKKDPMRPPKWALVGSTHPLAHIFEGGTGSRGASGFNHAGRHFPAIDGEFGLMRTTGLNRQEAFAMAQAIYRQGGLAAQPFVAPTSAAVQGAVVQMFERAVNEVTK